VLPAQQEAHEVLGAHQLDLAAQPIECAAVDAREQAPLAELFGVHSREVAAQREALGLERGLYVTLIPARRTRTQLECPLNIRLAQPVARPDAGSRAVSPVSLPSLRDRGGGLARDAGAAADLAARHVLFLGRHKKGISALQFQKDAGLGSYRASTEELTSLVRGAIDARKATLFTDAWQGYTALTRQGVAHRPRVGGHGPGASDLLPWAHTVFGNLKTWLQGTFHGVSPKHLQRYLDEFVYRFDRRWIEAALSGFVLRRAVHTWGTPLQILEKLEARKRLLGGFETLAISRYGGMSFEDAEKSLRLFAGKLLPEVHSW
jgi:hypothetical protein